MFIRPTHLWVLKPEALNLQKETEVGQGENYASR